MRIEGMAFMIGALCRSREVVQENPSYICRELVLLHIYTLVLLCMSTPRPKFPSAHSSAKS